MFTAASLVLSIYQLVLIVKRGEISYWVGNWMPPYGIEFAVDSLSAVVLILICIMGVLTMIYGMPFLNRDSRRTNAGYYSALALFLLSAIF